MSERPADPWRSIQYAAEQLGVSDRTILRRIDDGTLPAARIVGSRLIRVRQSDIDAMLRPVPTGDKKQA